MNKALIAKWWVRFNDPSIRGLWKSVILAKYDAQGYHSKCSSFWKGVIKEADVVHLGFL